MALRKNVHDISLRRAIMAQPSSGSSGISFLSLFSILFLCWFLSQFSLFLCFLLRWSSVFLIFHGVSFVFYFSSFFCFFHSFYSFFLFFLFFLLQVFLLLFISFFAFISPLGCISFFCLHHSDPLSSLLLLHRFFRFALFGSPRFLVSVSYIFE